MLKTSCLGQGSGLVAGVGILAPGACTSLVPNTQQIPPQPLLTIQTLAFLRGIVPSCLPFHHGGEGPQAASASWAPQVASCFEHGLLQTGCTIVSPMAVAREKTPGQSYMGTQDDCSAEIGNSSVKALKLLCSLGTGQMPHCWPSRTGVTPSSSLSHQQWGTPFF